MAATDRQVTRLLRSWRGGDAAALDALTPLVYQELRRVAQNAMSGENSGHTLQATALVHEAYARLVDADIPWQDRVHFFAIAARTMRRILVDHARAKQAEKRSGDTPPITLNEALVADAGGEAMLELDDALARLAEHDERKAHVVELHYFGGLTYEEIAEAMAIAPVTVHRDLRLAKAWLLTAMGQPNAADE